MLRSSLVAFVTACARSYANRRSKDRKAVEEAVPLAASPEEARKQSLAWCATALEQCRNVVYYRRQRDAFLRAALEDPRLAAAATRIVGPGWRNLLE
jgi:hypothetical protein